MNPTPQLVSIELIDTVIKLGESGFENIEEVYLQGVLSNYSTTCDANIERRNSCLWGSKTIKNIS